ncbi:AAA family ATPase [Endozoicomonas atrinae]|uniref:AAA family ATPase n=2 Tax=Endozoicomonas atrinae TaxID=1333660 RepID=UPI003B008E23
MTTTTDKLREAVQNTNGNERRAQLRKLFKQTVGNYLKKCNWQAIGKRSPLIGSGQDQYNLRPTWSEYRDRCSVQVMAYMVDRVIEYHKQSNFKAVDDFVIEFVLAITEPEDFARAADLDAPVGSVRRYHFGYNSKWICVEDTWNALGGNTKKQPARKQLAPQQKPITKDSNMDTWTISTEQKDRELLDSVLKQVTNNEVSVERIESAINGGLQAQKRNQELEAELRRKPKHLSAPITIPKGLPDLKNVAWTNANEVFRAGQRKVKALDFDIPVFEWSGAHRDVPEVDENYVFRTDLLVPVLLALTDNTKAWISGHTGTGKSTLVKQVAARMAWPVITLSLDGEITRMDLIGRDSLTTKDGKTVSQFVDGVLPRAFSQPCILLCDEIDFVRDDIAYTLQTALNENEVTVTEDGGRVVRATEWSRIIATANTLGQGDDSGLYRGAKVQSQAFLDRFTTWIEVPYMAEGEERNLITNAYKELEPTVIDSMLQYAKEHREGFVNATILQPLSPRGMLALADKYLRYYPLFSDGKAALRQAINETLLNRSNAEDRIVLEGIINRVFAIK